MVIPVAVLLCTDYHYVETPSAIYEDEGDDAYVCMWGGNYGGGPIVSHAGSEPSYAGLFNQSRDQLTSLRVWGALAGSRTTTRIIIRRTSTQHRLYWLATMMAGDFKVELSMDIIVNMVFLFGLLVLMYDLP